MLPSLINLNYYCDVRLLDPVTGQPIEQARLAQVLTEPLAELELSRQRTVALPAALEDMLSYRPTPLFEARTFAEALGGRTRIFVKDEGATPSSNHKMNSALWVAYHCSRAGLKVMTTETTGNWGIALALAGTLFGIRVICFIDATSVRQRPDRVRAMTEAGAEVIVAEDEGGNADPLTLSASAAVRYTLRIPEARYIFGSVYNYFVLPQTMVGLEAAQQLPVRPDLVVGSCGGGANLLGIAAAFLVDRLETGSGPDLLCAEAEECPVVSKGRWGDHSIEDSRHYPLMRTYGLERLLGDTYIGGLGSTIVAGAVADLHSRRLLATATFPMGEARQAAELFERTEGRRVALETGYQLAAVAREVRRGAYRNVLVNISTVGNRSYA
ncbi:pyridoxal-phosphate dependent enzyme [Dactylosporangium roseum]|uniref:tryptophan synthase n=1 Tax=Dactylosporangium roseum TaxID=47989 RepID=A0ABY5ZCM4_9ACTN|nr:pyridoxal-phosphate dependent enzyme [Dactylosporangium roseum]UWZ39409.1 pyridoxal-phosphate dependent enzyme [Dactylosporangium roseum]